MKIYTYHFASYIVCLSMMHQMSVAHQHPTYHLDQHNFCLSDHEELEERYHHDTCPILCASFNPQPSCSTWCSPACRSLPDLTLVPTKGIMQQTLLGKAWGETVHIGIVPCEDNDNGTLFYNDLCCDDGDKQSSLYIGPGVLCFEIASRNLRDASPLPRIWKSSVDSSVDLIEGLTHVQSQLGTTTFATMLPSVLSCLSAKDKEQLTSVASINLCAAGYPLAEQAECSECLPSCYAPSTSEHITNGTCARLTGCCPFNPQTETLTFMFDQICSYADGAYISLLFTTQAYDIIDGSLSPYSYPVTFTACLRIEPGMTLEEFLEVNHRDLCY